MTTSRAWMRTRHTSAIPAHSRLRVTLAAKSTAQTTGNLVYLNDVPPESRLAIRRATLRTHPGTVSSPSRR